MSDTSGHTQRDASREIHEALESWTPSEGSLDRLYDLSRKTLDEVTRLTEYEDGKASRVLTAVAFLTALAGGLYGTAATKGLIYPSSVSVWLYHGLFLIFVLLVVSGAYFVVQAIRPTFNIPRSWSEKQKKKHEQDKQGQQAAEMQLPSISPEVQAFLPADPRSFLFALQIVKSTPKEWVTAFRRHGEDKAESLKAEYVKDHIHESYLVAEKVVRKLRPLQKGMHCFVWGMCFLGVWLVVTVISIFYQQMCPAAATPSAITGSIGRTAVVFTDADNTLWDTNGLYATAQLSLLERLEAVTGQRATGDRLEFVRAVDQRIAKDHSAGLRYPPQLLIVALKEALAAQGAGHPKTVPGTAPATKPATASSSMQSPPDFDADQEASKYLDTVAGLPALRPGVRSGLERLQTEGVKIIVVTEGGESTVLKRLNHHGLLPFVYRVVELQKSPRAYQALAEQFGKGAGIMFSVGDQLDRDIMFASMAGFRTIYFPGGFTPAWMPAVADAKPDYQIVSYDQVVDVVIRPHRR